MSKKNSLWKEFTEFAIKGNAMALAVGTIIGGAFSTITKSLTNDLIMPVVNIFLGGTDFSELKVQLPRITPVYEDVLNEAGEVIGQVEVPHYLTYGNFLSAIINFLIVAFCIFMMIKAFNKASSLAKKNEEPAPEAPTTKVCPFCCTEIDIKATRCPHCTSELPEIAEE